jgi:hypothetical protein
LLDPSHGFLPLARQNLSVTTSLGPAVQATILDGDAVSSLNAKNLLEVVNARQNFFGIFGRTARLFQNFLLKQVRWSEKKRQNLFRKAARLSRNLQANL